MPPSKRPPSSIASTSSASSLSTTSVVDHDPCDVRDEHEAIGAEPDRKRSRGLIGVDVERPDGERGDDRDPTAFERLGHRRGRRRLRIPDEPESGDLRRAQPDRVAEQPDRVRAELGADLGIDVRQRLTDHLEHLGRRHPPPVHEHRLDPTPLELGRDLGPRPVDDDDRASLPSEGVGQLGRTGCDAATQLEHDERHVVYSALILM